MSENLDAEIEEVFFEFICSTLTVILCYNNRADIKSYTSEKVDKSEYLFIVGDIKVTTKLLFFDSLGTYSDDDFSFILELKKHLELTVGFKTGKYSCSVMVVEKLAAEFKIELTAKL